MSLSIGIVGLPNVGKSTLFNALTKQRVSAENFPFCTIDPSVGIVSVPDHRLEGLSKLSGSAKTIPAAVEFVDIAGLVRGAAEGEGLGNKFLSHIREVDAIAQVVRIFDDPDITHVHGAVDPMSDIDVINLELSMADHQTVTKRIGNVERDAKRGEKEAIKELAVLEKISTELVEGGLIRNMALTEDEHASLKHLNLLTAKPVMYVLNKKAGGLNLDEQQDDRYKALIDFLDAGDDVYVTVDACVEQDLSEVSDEDQEGFRREFGVLESGVQALIKRGYELLGLISYFTTGETETRAWTVKRDSTAPHAGAAIHSDFRDKFIRADVVSYDQLMEAGSYAKAREKGWVRTEGKEYIVKDGDVVEFRI